jgi:hypothetical protein
MGLNLATARALSGSGVASNLPSSGTTVFGPLPVSGRRLSVQATWTGTPTGTFALQCSFDGTNYTTVPGASAEFTANSQAQPAGGGSSAIWNWSNVPGNMARILYTATSGTGTLTIRAAQGA